MSYEPTNWKAGDVVTSAKLNKLEQGVAGGILIVHSEKIGSTESNRRLDKTWMEIHNALFNGTIVLVLTDLTDEYAENVLVSFITRVFTAHEQQPQLYYVYINNSEDGYTTDSANGYPEYKDEDN